MRRKDVDLVEHLQIRKGGMRRLLRLSYFVSHLIVFIGVVAVSFI